MTTYKYKNYQRETVRIVDSFGRSCVFKAGQERELDVSWDKAVLAAGIVPLDDVNRETANKETEIEALAAEAQAQAEADAQAEAERAKRLEDAAFKARSEAAKKGAATRAAKAAK